MGAAPSILTVPSTSITKDVECLKALCPGRFRPAHHDENHPSGSDFALPNENDTTAILTDTKNSGLTLVFVTIPVAAASRIVANRVTFVVPDAELKSVVNRCETMRLSLKTHPPFKNTSNNNTTRGSDYDLEPTKPIEMAEVNLPGGAGFALVSPAMMMTGQAQQQELGQKLAESLLQSLPKGISRTNSLRQLRSVSTPRATPERRQSLGGGSTSGRSTPTQLQTRERPLPMSRPSPRASPRNSNTANNGYNFSPTMLKSSKLKKSNSYNNIVNLIGNTNNNNHQKKDAIHHHHHHHNSEPPSFPTLKFSSLHLNGKYRHDFVPNARASIPIETELFVGHMVFLMRSTDVTGHRAEVDDVYNQDFFDDKNRRLVMQVQGKFKYEPKGTVYAGMEASNDSHLGRLSKGLSGLLLSWAEAKNHHVYHSFGADDKEKPRVVMPAHAFFDRIVVTPSGETPPSLFEPLEEGQVSIDYRKRQTPGDAMSTKQAQWTWNINDNYSMAFFTSNVDLPNWSLLDVPQLQGLKLSNLIGNSILRFVMYENVTPKEKGPYHLQQYLRYSYVVQCKFLGQQARQEVLSESSDTILDWATTKNENNEKNDHDSLQLKQAESDKFPSEERAKKDVDSDHFLEQEDDCDKSEEVVSKLPDLRLKNSKSSFISLATCDILCPAWIEMCAPQGKYTRAYAFNVNNRTVFRTPQSFCDLVSVKNYLPDKITDAMMDKLCSPRVSAAERTRRKFGKMLESSLLGQNAEMLKRMMEIYSSQFLRTRDTSWPAIKPKPSGETGGIVARALSDRHWVEEWAEITKTSISFSQPETKRVHLSIKMDCVLCIRCVEDDEAPKFHNYFFMAVETLGRTTYIMFATEDDRRECFTSISKFISSDKLPLYLNAPRKEFLQQSSLWNCGQRLIMNNRQMSFRTPPTAEQLDPLKLVEEALTQAFDEAIERDDDKLQVFLDSVSKLKSVNANDLKEERRLAFFLNLYHVMVRHSALIFGASSSQSTLVKNFMCLSYQCSDDIFSIGELEHNILRAQMTQLASSVSSTNTQAPPPINSRLLKATSPLQMIPSETFNFPTPTSSYCFAIQKADFRICFALNCGSKSNIDQVPIYTAQMLNQQLDETCREFLKGKVGIKQREKYHVCVLPRICQWYANDFGETNYAVLKTLEPYLEQAEQSMLHSADFAKFPINIKYLPFSFQNRQVTLKLDQPHFLRSKYEDDDELRSTQSGIYSQSTTGSSTHSSVHSISTAKGAPHLRIVDAPPVIDNDDMDSLLAFLMDDALEI